MNPAASWCKYMVTILGVDVHYNSKRTLGNHNLSENFNTVDHLTGTQCNS